MRIKFAGYDLTKKFTLMDDLNRPMPEFRHASTEVMGRDGMEFDTQTIGMRTCSFSLAATAATPEKMQLLWRELTAALAVREPAKLTFSDEVDEHGTQLARYAVPSGLPDLTEWMRAGIAKITFEQDDPYLYGRQRSAVLKNGVSKVIETGGNAPAHPKLVAKVNRFSTGTEFGLLDENDAVLSKVAVWYDGGTARTVTIDEAKLSVKISPAPTNHGLVLSSRFFELDGTCRVYAGGSGTLSWRERWL